LSAWDVEDVAATAAGVICLRGGGTAACWRVAGASTGGAGVGAGAGLAAAVFAAGAVFTLVLVAAVLVAAFGAALRAIGRGFGNGTFVVAQASTERLNSPAASARLAASAVDRSAAARAERVTAILCGGESFSRSSLGVYLTEYVDKMLKRSLPALFAPSPRQNRGYRLFEVFGHVFVSRNGVKTKH